MVVFLWLVDIVVIPIMTTDDKGRPEIVKKLSLKTKKFKYKTEKQKAQWITWYETENISKKRRGKKEMSVTVTNERNELSFLKF